MTTNELVTFLEHMRADMAEDGRQLTCSLLDGAIAKIRHQELTIEQQAEQIKKLTRTP